MSTATATVIDPKAAAVRLRAANVQQADDVLDAIIAQKGQEWLDDTVACHTVTRDPRAQGHTVLTYGPADPAEPPPYDGLALTALKALIVSKGDEKLGFKPGAVSINTLTLIGIDAARKRFASLGAAQKSLQRGGITRGIPLPAKP